MRSLWRRLALAVVAGGLLAGCDGNRTEAPKEYAPPPKTGPGGALKGGESPAAPTRPK